MQHFRFLELLTVYIVIVASSDGDYVALELSHPVAGWSRSSAERPVTQEIDYIITSHSAIPIVLQELVHFVHARKWSIAVFDNIGVVKMSISNEVYGFPAKQTLHECVELPTE